MNAIVSLLEKVIATFVQAFVAGLIVGPAIDISTAQAAALAAIPAGLTVVANGLPLVPVGLPFYVDLLLRTIRTFASSFLGFLIALPVFSLDYGVLQAAVAASIPAVLTVVKSGLASKVGDHETAALLPARLDLQSLPVAG